MTHAYLAVAQTPWGTVTITVPGAVVWAQADRDKLSERCKAELEIARATGMPAAAMVRRLERALRVVGGTVVVT